jgi:oxaloacetate decarboxylase alpha subunit
MGRYKTFTKESKGLLRGEYGELPGEVNEEIRKKAIGDDEVITCRPADNLEPELNIIKEQYGDIAKTEEDILSCAMFPQVAPDFIRRRDNLILHEIEVEWVH